MGLGQFLDKSIGTVFPRAGARRERARLEAAVTRKRIEMVEGLSVQDAARRDRTTADWNARTTSADGAIVADAATVNARARAAGRDHWMGASAISAYVRHLVGIGITPRSAATDARGEPLEEVRKILNLHFHRWARRPKYVDIERKRSFAAMQAMMVREFVQVGESFLTMQMVGGRPLNGLVLQAFEAEQLDTTKWRNERTGNEIRGGIEVDAYGAPVAYHVYIKSHPSDTIGSRSVPLPADKVLHFFDPERPRQSHGRSRLGPALIKMRQMQMYDSYTLIRARLEACIGGAIQTSVDGIDDNLGGLSGPTGSSATDDRGNATLRYEPGMMLDLAPGQEFKQVGMQTPGERYEPFTRQQATQVAAGTGLDFATLARDFSQGSYSSQRQGLIEMRGEIDPLQQLLIDQVLRPVWVQFVFYEVLQGFVAAPGFFEDPEPWIDATWQGPPRPWIDPLKEVKARGEALDRDLTTLEDEANTLGRDWRATVLQRAAERELIRELAPEPAVAPGGGDGEDDDEDDNPAPPEGGDDGSD